ncbi:MAG: iron-containing alcohol dehydrogenase [Thermotogaceae bacterium]|nr:iron-containing alcohol dehydrogenase [Thermotogaceae bacterium]
MKSIETFDYFLPTRIIFGCGTIGKVGQHSRRLGKKALIVTGRHSTKKTGLLDKVIGLLKEEGISSVVFDEIVPNPLSTSIDRGASIAVKERCDFIIGLGGGSPIDSSKLIALVAKDGGKCWDYTGAGGGRKPKAALPVIAIPTTHGTGTEADPFAVVTNPETNEKIGVGFDEIFPAVSIVDPELMLSLPPEQTAATGMDAFYHSIESYINLNHQPASDLLALESMSLINHYLPIAYENPNDLDARVALAWASTAAGICETLSGCVANHSLEHPVSGHYNATHGAGLCATGPSLLEYIRPHIAERLAEVARVMGAPESVIGVEELSKMAIVLLRRLQKNVGLDISLGELGVESSKLSILAEDAMRTMGGLVSVTPGNLKTEDLRNIYEMSM